MEKCEKIQDEAGKKLQDWITLMSDQNNGCLEDLQADWETKEQGIQVCEDHYDEEHDLSNVVDIKYHDIDEDDTEVEEQMYSGTVSFTNKDTFRGFFSSDMRTRRGTCHKNIPLNNLGTTGTWKCGLLEGIAWMENDYGGYEETFFTRGVKHGYSRSFGPQPKKKYNLWHVALYRDGGMLEHFWHGCLGGGFITGVSDDNEMTGYNIAYIFPNLKDAIQGQFVKGKLLRGSEVKVLSIEIVNGIAMALFTKQSGLKSVTRDMSTKYIIASTPLQRDALEHARVYVKLSKTPDSGEGLFAKAEFKEGDLVSIFNGISVSTTTTYEWSDYKVNFNPELDLDIPMDMRRLENDLLRPELRFSCSGWTSTAPPLHTRQTTPSHQTLGGADWIIQGSIRSARSYQPYPPSGSEKLSH